MTGVLIEHGIKLGRLQSKIVVMYLCRCEPLALIFQYNSDNTSPILVHLLVPIYIVTVCGLPLRCPLVDRRLVSYS